jgi:microcystin-dependent protein
VSIRTNFANAFETTLTAEMGPTDLEAHVLSTLGGPTSPAYLVIDPDDPGKREYILFDGSFGSGVFRTTTTNNRYLSNSAAGSGITHEEGAVVRMAATRQHFEDLHSRIDTRMPSSAHTKSQHTSMGLAENPHGNEAHTQQFATAADAVPSGVIVLWSGTTSNVPSGWALCNGSNGTPDLRDRFVVGSGGAYNPGSTGGASTVTLTNSQIPSHSHTANAGNSGNHTHGAGNLAGGNHSHGSGNLSGGSHDHNLSLNTGSANLNHSHSGANLNTSNTGSHSHGHTRTSNQASVNSGNLAGRTLINNANTDSAGAHSHNISGDTGTANLNHAHSVSGSTGNSSVGVSGNTSASTVGVSGNTSGSGDHSHAISLGNTGGGGSHENRPPYFSLAYIMKL